MGRSNGVQETSHPATSLAHVPLGPILCRSPPKECLAEKRPTALALPHANIPESSSWLRVWLLFPLLVGRGVDAWSCCSARHSDRTSASGSAPVCSWEARGEKGWVSGHRPQHLWLQGTRLDRQQP